MLTKKMDVVNFQGHLDATLFLRNP